MNAWQIGLIVFGVLALVSFVWAEFRGGVIRKRPPSRLADRAGVESNAHNISNQSSGLGS